MADEVYKFRAFLSYSRQDEDAVRRLHRRLEAFEIPKALRKDGAAKLGRFFRDKDELGAAAELGDELTAKIGAAEWLIVCCSPASADSKWVNAEVESFIATHGQGHVLAAILDGEPHEVFPAVLREREPLAADFRKAHDGEDLGFLKLVAGILGVDLGELRDRQAAAERAKARNRAMLASVFALLAVAASVSAVIAVQQRDRAALMAREAIDIGAGVIEKTDDLSRKYGVPTSAVEELLTFSKERFDRLFANGVKSAELERKRAQVLVQYSELYGRMGQTKKQKEQALAALAILKKLPAKELRTLDYVRAHAGLCNAEMAEGRGETALTHCSEAVRAARQLVKDVPNGRLGRIWLAGSLQRLADIHLSNGESNKALPLLQETASLLEQVYQQSPQDDVAVTNYITALDRLGGAQALNQDAKGAETSLLRAISLSRAWLGKKPDSLSALRNLGASLTKLGQLRADREDYASALVPLQDSVDIARDLTKADPRDASAREDLALRLVLLSNVLEQLGEPSAPLANEAIAMARDLVTADPENAGKKESLARLLAVRQSAQARAGNAAAARATAYEIVALRRALLALAPKGAPGPAADLAFALELVGDQSASLRDVKSMRAAYTEAAALRRAAVSAAPRERAPKRNLAAVLHALGLTLKFDGDPQGSAAALEEAATIRTTLANADTSDADAAFMAVDSWQQLAVVQAGFDGAACKASFQKAEQILLRLTKAHPNDTRYADSLAKTQAMLKMIAESQNGGGATE